MTSKRTYLGGDFLFQRASSWSKCCDCAKAACSGPKPWKKIFHNYSATVATD